MVKVLYTFVYRCPDVARQRHLEFPHIDGDLRMEASRRVRPVLPADESRGRSPDRLLHGHVHGGHGLHSGQRGSQGNIGNKLILRKVKVEHW